MKWVLHVQSPRIAEQSVNDIFRADPLRDDAVLVSPNLDSVLSIVTRCVETRAARLRGDLPIGADEDFGAPPPPEIMAIICGKLPHSILSSPSCPVRTCVANLLRFVNGKASAAQPPGTLLAVCCAVEAAAGKSIAEMVSLEQRLVAPRGHVDDRGTFEGFGLRFGPRQNVPAGFVELHTVWEWESIVQSLLTSASFRDVERHVTIHARVAAVSLRSGCRCRVLQSFSFWFLFDLHTDEFLRTVVPTTLQPDGPSLAVGAALLSSTAQVLQYGEVAQSIWDQLMPARQREQRAMRRSASQARGALDEASPQAVEQLQAELRVLEARKRTLLEESRRDDLADVPSPVAAVEQARRELSEMGDAHDAAERRFSSVVRKLSEEKNAVEKSESDIKECERRAQSALLIVAQLSDDKSRLSAKAAALSEERDRLLQEIDAAEAAKASHSKERLRAESERDGAIGEELKREEEELLTLHQQHVKELATHQRGLDEQLAQYEANASAKVEALERRLRHAKDGAAVESAKFSEVSATAVAMQSEVQRAKREINETVAQLALLSEKLWKLRDDRHGGTADSVLKLQLEEASTEASLSAANAEHQRLSTWLATHEEAVASQEAQSAAKHRECAECQRAVEPRYRQQQLQFVHSMVRIESQERERIEAAERLDLAEIMQWEPFAWHRAMAHGEVYFHERSHGRMRDALIEANREVTVTLSRVSLAMRQAEEFTEKFQAADASHAELMGQCRAQLDEVKEEEARFRERASVDGGELDMIEMLNKRLAERTALLRRCLTSAPVGEPIRSAIPIARGPHVPRPHPELMQRLARVSAHTAGRLEVAQAAEEVQKQKLARLERELEERTSISAHVRESIWEADRNVAAAEDVVEQKGTALKNLSEKHDILRQQLKEEFIFAQEVTARHRAEAQEQLKNQRVEHDQFVEALHRTEKELKALRLRRDELRRRNTSTNEATIILELQRELSRQAKLRDAIRIEEAH